MTDDNWTLTLTGFSLLLRVTRAPDDLIFKVEAVRVCFCVNFTRCSSLLLCNALAPTGQPVVYSSGVPPRTAVAIEVLDAS